MRIGVHSGSLMAGVMGAAKLQYDVWGEDVIIAGILESTGRPGHIHISERTSKMLIDNPYELLPGTEKALQHPHLASKNIKTFLIAALDYKIVLRQEQSSQALETIQDLEMQKKEALRIEFDKLPVGSFHVKNKFTTIFRKKSRTASTERATTRPQIGFLFLNFRDSRKELNYMKQPDYMLRYSVLLAWFAGVFLVYLVNISHKANKTSVNNNIIVMVLLTTPVIILWFKKACHWRYGNVPHNFTKCSCFIFKTAECIQSSLIIRMGIYMNMIVCYFWLIFQVLKECDYDEFHLQLIESKLYHYEMDKYKCFYSWDLTNMMSLMIALSIIFTRIPWMVKIIVSVLEGTTYMIIMFIQFEYVINRSSTTNPYFDSEYAHGFKIMATLGCLYFMERQAEFNSRVNYNWKLELLKKQNDAVITNKSITILLQNILPAHVVNIYLTSLAKHQLYAENYKMVAVMFASLQDFKMDVRNLRILNEIISQFDKI
ncbi:PREDICTED: adenylate cyclase type 2-like, partial [Drosophila arizonae]|uniref:adenylate cyclase n=1 Tax=Drosophila arizonae TaxID=7263 RepID=A0ABM1Q0E5_DROAR